MHVQDVGCLVTGASAGIGRALALELGRRRCRVALLARRPEPLERVAAEVEAAGGAAAALPVDVADAEAMREAVEQAAAWAGGLRLVIANAGVGVHGGAGALPDADVRRASEVNYLGAFSTVRAALPHLRAGAPSAVVALTSLAGLVPYRGGSAYGASKAALIAALRCLRLELAGTGVAVGWLSPGPVHTGMIVDGVPRDRLPYLARLLVPVLPPERVARAAIRLAERGGGGKVIPASAAFFAALSRHLPRTAERIELWTGAGTE